MTRGATARAVVVDCAAYVAIFGVLAAPWLARAATALPSDIASRDAWLILWVLDWGTHALATSPAKLFDPPVNYPALAQLAGSEHFLAWQILFAPLRVLTGSAFVAANLTAWVSYPLAALAMERCLVGFGVARAPAFALGFVYGVGWGSMGTLHVLQYSHVCLPLVVLALHALRRRPDPPRTLAVFGAVGFALFSSYHMAVYVGLVAPVWTAAELLRPGPGRWRFAALAAGAGLAALALLLWVSGPYLTRPETAGDTELVESEAGTAHLAGAPPLLVRESSSVPELVASIAGCVAGAGHLHPCMRAVGEAPFAWHLALPNLVLGSLALVGIVSAFVARRRRLEVVAALAVACLGALAVEPLAVHVLGFDVPLLATWLTWTPARFIRASYRALVMTFFGTSLVAGIGLDAAWSRLGARRAAVPALIVCLLVAVRLAPLPPGAAAERRLDGVTRWSRLAPAKYLTTPALDRDADAYRAVAAFVAREGSGPLLEWPSGIGDPAATVAQMIHRQPSIRFFTGYVPLHLLLVESLIGRLPDTDALDDLVDMTGLRWILVRPPYQWRQPARYAADLDRLVHSPRVRRSLLMDPFILVELDPSSRHPAWFRAVASGVERDHTVLGTPVVMVRSGRAGVVAGARGTVSVGRRLPVTVEVTNRGSAGWPAALPGRPVDGVLTVRLFARWVGADGHSEDLPAERLRRDVPAGETLRQTVMLPAPREPGSYRLEVGVEQVGGADLSSPQNPISIPVEVEARRDGAGASDEPG
ncbi:MAG TPA: hypothetical protein VMS22_03710 [Candidatus Eisenbacteria bacterium]|nr:hypothetical protein [Candidatus Eisenbacteria bacterium]